MLGGLMRFLPEKSLIPRRYGVELPLTPFPALLLVVSPALTYPDGRGSCPRFAVGKDCTIDLAFSPPHKFIEK